MSSGDLKTASTDTHTERLHLELEHSRVAVPFNSPYISGITSIFKCPIISIVLELRHAHCCLSSYQSNSRPCLSTTRVGSKFKRRNLNRHLPSDGIGVAIVQKGGDLTQSYDKSPYTHGNVKRGSDNTNNATKKFD